MLSVILYGRNDSHGYNLHKRAAISLNCLARLLTDTDDEIIFVDYNTPDDLPTFPEAIADTLTPEARRLLRVIRVRSSLHLPYVGRTHLSCLESQSRNIAIRRSNPANRWVLSTNPDMIFAPRDGVSSFSKVLRDLPDGCWHLPRFELPETFWEGFDRMNPDGIVGQLAGDGHRIHLDEVVYGNEAALFDGHGDFQLMLRDDLFHIHGFNEEMISGWHVDSNLAKRMLLLRGRIDHLTGHFVGYHCDHTRMASVSHGHNRVENDIRRFFDDVAAPDLPNQAANWGLPDEDLEEIRLDQQAIQSMLRLLTAVTQAPEVPYYQGDCTAASRDLPHYPAEHALPYLLDVMVTMDRRCSYAWIGTRPHMFRLFLAVWRELGFTGGLMVPNCCRALLAEDAADDVTLLSNAEVLEGADQFIFEFGAASQDRFEANAWSNDDLTRLAPVRRLFFNLVDQERDRAAQGRPLRRVVTVNAVNNRFEAMVSQALSATRTPFNTRIRQGFVIASSPRVEITPQELTQWLGPAMHRRQAVPITETVRVLSNLHDMLNTTPTPERLRTIHAGAASLLALLDHPALIRREGAERLGQVRRATEAGRPSTVLASRLSFPVVAALPEPGEAPCRLATCEDWEDEETVSLARRYFTGMFAASTLQRSCGLWGRLSLLAALVRLGLAGDGGRLLVVDVLGDELIDVGTEMMGVVHVLDPSTDGNSDKPARVFRDPSRLTFLREAELSGGYDAVLFSRQALFHDGPAAAVRLLTVASRNLRMAGMLGFIEDVAVEGSSISGGCDPRQWLDDGFARQVEDGLGLRRLPAAAAALTRATVDSVAWNEPGWVGPHFLSPADGVLTTCFACIFTKVADVGATPLLLA
jgi:hypothetical protein